jgi:hypothetical protein
VSSLWTPSGEHQPRPTDETAPMSEPAAGGSRRDAEAGPPGSEPDEPQLREMLARLAATPVAAIVADHAIRLHELAVLHLGLAAERPESLAEARLATDAMAELVEGLAERLGDAAAPLSEALAQLRLAYVQVSERPSGE